MLKNYLKIAVRNFSKHRGSSLINLIGLAVGFSCCILIFLWIQDEMSYDRYHENAQHLYRVYSETKFSDGPSQISSSSFTPLARLLRAQCPEVIEAGRIAEASSILARSGDKVFTDNVFRFVDPAIFRMFTFVFLKGDPKTVFDDPSSRSSMSKFHKSTKGDSMAKARSFLSLMLFFGILAWAGPSLQPADLSGTWIGKTEVPNVGTDEVTLVLKKAEKSYSGTISDNQAVINPNTEIKDVTIDGEKLSFIFSLADGNLITIKLTVAGDKMTGQWEHPEGSTGTIEFIRKK